jgi:predicted Zn-dependent peptidase
MKMRKPDSFIEKLAFSGSAYANWVDHDSYHKPGCLRYADVVDFYHQYYVPQNIVISVVSSISFDAVVRHISTTPFAEALPRSTMTLPIMNSTLGALDSHCESNYMLHSNSGETARIEIAVRVCDQFKNDEFYALNTLRHIVSNSMSSRLFVELREKRGLTYRSGAYMTLYETAGIFVLYAISDITRLVKDGKTSNPGVIPVMFDILDDLIKNGVNETELKRAKNNIKDSLKMSVIAGGDKSAYNGIRVMLHNDTEILPNSEIYDKCYKKLSKSHINAIIQKYFSSRNYYFSVIGGKLPKSDVLVHFLSPLDKAKK